MGKCILIILKLSKEIIIEMKVFTPPLLITIIIVCCLLTGCSANPDKKEGNSRHRRGIVVYPSDIKSVGVVKWMGLMKTADLNLLGIHGFNNEEGMPELKTFLESNEGKLLFEECRKKNIEIEFETHALHLLLPRELFNEHPEYFRMDENGVRRKDFNICFSSEGAFREIEKKINEITKWLKPTTNRYFFWADDVLNGYCHCGSCIKYTESEQALIYENRLLAMLRKINPSATLAHLAYNNTYKAPVKIIPSEGIFLEYAPIDRDLTKPIPEEHVRNLKNNLQLFPVKSAHILEYWIDVSKFSVWKKDSLVHIPWNKQNCERDAELYNSMGIRSMTSFGVWINNDYITKYGADNLLKVLTEYGSVLKKYLN